MKASHETIIVRKQVWFSQRFLRETVIRKGRKTCPSFQNYYVSCFGDGNSWNYWSYLYYRVQLNNTKIQNLGTIKFCVNWVPYLLTGLKSIRMQISKDFLNDCNYEISVLICSKQSRSKNRTQGQVIYLQTNLTLS